jgi:hypothetical protein
MRCNDSIKVGDQMNSIATQRGGVVRALVLCDDCGEGLDAWLGEPAVRWSSTPDEEHTIVSSLSGPEPKECRFARAARILNRQSNKPIRFPSLEPHPSIEQLSTDWEPEPSFHDYGKPLRASSDTTDPLSSCEHRIHRVRCSQCWNPEGEIDA